MELTNAAGTQRFTMSIRQESAEHFPRIYCSAIASPAYISPSQWASTSRNAQKALGRQRVVWTHETGNPVAFRAGPFSTALSATSAVAVSIDKLYVGHGRTASSGADNFMSLIKRVIIWPERATAAGLANGVTSRDNYDISVVGDSFTNQQPLPALSMSSAVQMNFAPLDYRRITINAIGGTPMEDQVDFVASAPDTWQDWIVWLDGGRGNYFDAVDRVQDMLDIVGHRRIVLLGAGPHQTLTIGEPERDTWDAMEAALEAAYPDLWVSTLAEAQALGDGSTADNDKIADGLWPVSLTVSADDFHPNNAGRQLYADISTREIRAREGDLAWLFDASEVGGWYDATDLSTLFQDSAGTIPVTAPGDRVGRWEDKSGNGYHLLQTSASARPTYQTDGTYHWVETDGISQWLKAAFTSTATFTRISAFRQITLTSDDRVFGGGAAQGGELVQRPGPSLRMQSGVNADPFSTIALAEDAVLTEVFAGTSSSYAVGNDDPTTVSAGTNNPGGLAIGAGYNGSVSFNYGNMRFYGVVMIAGSLTPWVRQVRKRLAAISGATL